MLVLPSGFVLTAFQTSVVGKSIEVSGFSCTSYCQAKVSCLFSFCSLLNSFSQAVASASLTMRVAGALFLDVCPLPRPFVTCLTV
jgi:hypothetical protein